MSGGIIFPFGGEMPQELKDQIDRKTAEGKLMTRQFEDLLSRLTHDDMDVLNALFIQFARESDQALYFAGIVMGYQHKYDGSCLGCGHIHDDVGDALHGILEKDGPKLPLVDKEAIAAEVAHRRGETIIEEMVMLFSEEQYDKLCDEYRVNPLELDKDKAFQDMRVMCQGCGMVYVTLQDRMLKDPASCSGCHIKAAQG